MRMLNDDELEAVTGGSEGRDHYIGKMYCPLCDKEQKLRKDTNQMIQILGHNYPATKYDCLVKGKYYEVILTNGQARYFESRFMPI